MAGEFQLRFLKISAYRAVVALMRRARDGEAEARETLIAKCRAALDAGALSRWGHEGGIDKTAFWRRELDRIAAEPTPERLEELGGMCVIACAMPDYQSFAGYGMPGAVLSPHLVMLADCDGGLFGMLDDASPWFSERFFDQYRDIAPGDEIYTFDHQLGVFAREDVPKIHAVATEFAASAEDLKENASWALDRLIDLCARVMADEDATIAVEMAL